METYLMELSREELAAMLRSWGEPSFRAQQVWQWLSRGVRPNGMKNIPKTLRERLDTMPWGGAEIYERHVSLRDSTIKYLFQMEDGALVEGVLMRYRHGNTLCLSTQVGCRMGCAFCASTLEGLARNLRHGEMLGQVLAVEQEDAASGQEFESADRAASAGRVASAGRAVTNIVLMGSGEPLDNTEHVFPFLRRITSNDGMHMSPRNISLSTCGIVPEILRMPQEAPHVTLCISLHAHSDDVRDTLLPINRKYPIAEVLRAADFYAKETGRRVIIEYALIEGINAGEADAKALARRLQGMLCHVNLIPLNPVAERDLKGVSRKQAAQFAQWLTQKGISATLRREMGTDIEGACGQLRRRVVQEGRETDGE